MTSGLHGSELPPGQEFHYRELFGAFDRRMKGPWPI
jgi:hypothetical protein